MVASGVTDHDGKVVLGAYARRDRIDIKATHEGHIPVSRKGFLLDGRPQSITIELEKEITLNGAVLPGRIFDYAPMIQVRTREGVIPGEGPLSCFHLNSAGQFQLAAPRGQLDFYIAIRVGGNYVLVSTPIGRIRLYDGEDPASVKLDASHAVPGSLEGMALVNGAPWQDGFIRLQSLVSGRLQPGYAARFAPGEGGRFVARDIPPGEYRCVGLASEGEMSMFAFDPVVVIRPAEKAVAKLMQTVTDVRIRLLADNHDLRKHPCVVWFGNDDRQAVTRHLVTNERAELDLRYVPYGPLHVEARIDGDVYESTHLGPDSPNELRLEMRK